MRRFIPYVCALVALLTTSPAAARPATSWAYAELKAVVAAGLMTKEIAARPNDPLTRGALETLVAGLTHAAPAAPSRPAAAVTMTAFDSRLVTTLGLGDAAKLFTQGEKTAGIT